MRVEPPKKEFRTNDAFDDHGCIVSKPEDFNLPTLEQCENLAVAMGLPILAEGLRPPYYFESMRNLHALIQKAVTGDVEAATVLEILCARFGREI